MPNTVITLYLNDEEYVKYIPRKKELNAKLRDTLKELLKNDEK